MTDVGPPPPPGHAAPSRAAALAAGALGVVLAGFRVEKIGALELTPGPAGWLAALLPDLAFSLLVFALWCAAGTLLPKTWTNRVLAGLVVCLALVAVIEQQFFLHTGSGLRFGLALYAMEHRAGLRDILATGLEPTLPLRAALVLLCFLLAWRLHATRRWSLGLLERRGPALVAAALALVLFAIVQRQPATHSSMGLAALFDLRGVRGE